MARSYFGFMTLLGAISLAGIAIIFGLIFATVLTLDLVPVLYSIFFRVKYTGWEYERGG